MTVKESIEELKKLDGNLKVIVCDGVEGNDRELLRVESGQTQVDTFNILDEYEISKNNEGATK